MLLRATLMLRLAVLLAASLTAQAAGECRSRSFGWDSVVCVCDAGHCDEPGSAASFLPPKEHYTTVTSSKAGLRFQARKHALPSPAHQGSAAAVVVEVASDSPQQTMLGFGGAFTDSSAMNIAALSPAAQEALIRSYFAPEGIEYDLCRVPIGGTDFSTRPYTYDDDSEGDVGLKDFALAEEDLQYKLPLLRQAQEVSRRPLRFLASPWSPPAWMKTNNKINETGELLPEMEKPWTDYLVRFVKEYQREGVPVWGLTTQNHGFTYGTVKWNSMSWRPERLRDWIKQSLGPSLAGAGLGHLKLLVGDDDRRKVRLTRPILSDREASKYVSGVASHWYYDMNRDVSELDHSHLLFPDKFLLYTEACIVPGEEFGPEAVRLGSWGRAEFYAEDIIEIVNHRVTGFIDWNLALDVTGGPNWAENTVDAPIIVNFEKDEFYKQPMFYAMGHFSKFVPAGSVALPSWVNDGSAAHQVRTTAFFHPQGYLVLQLLNKGPEEAEVRLEVDGKAVLHTLLPGSALQTLLLPWDGNLAHAKNKYTSEGHCDSDSCH